jgi:hypothetical protein
VVSEDVEFRSDTDRWVELHWGENGIHNWWSIMQYSVHLHVSNMDSGNSYSLPGSWCFA